MKVPRYTLTTALAFCQSHYSNTLLTGNKSRLIQTNPKTMSAFSGMPRRTPSSSALSMIFEKFFSSLGGGGAFGLKIDYNAMSYPVPQLASLALSSTVPEEIERTEQETPQTSLYHVATFAGGCFWGLELAYQRVRGVEFTAVGYTQGRETEPNYDMVCAG